MWQIKMEKNETQLAEGYSSGSTVVKTHFFTQIVPPKLGVRLIHKARYLGCFTSSIQATQGIQLYLDSYKQAGYFA